MPHFINSPCHPRSYHFRSPYCLALGLACFFLSCVVFADEDPSRIWIGRPWEFRYIMRIESPDDYGRWRKLYKKEISENNTHYSVNIESIFPLTTSISTDPKEPLKGDQAIGTVVITFNKQAEVTSPHNWPHNLSGHLNRSYNLVLAFGNEPQDMQFLLGEWYTGRSDAEIEYVPAICTLDDNDRNKGGFFADGLDRVGNFGCREWGYYLQNDKIPYIDVTSYGKDKSTYIRPVVGWGRFDVPPKPVIGKHGNVWVCLHECPNGEMPGVIPNIKVWAAKNGWSVPKPSKRQPMFPDRQFKHGELVD